jgi:uncharacterized protein (TIGR00369 family)
MSKTNNAFRDLLGIQEVSMHNGSSIIKLEITESLTQRHRTVHGGVIATMIDCAVGTAIRSIIPEKSAAVTLEMKLNYVRPATGATLIGKGNIINKGNSIIVGEARILNEKDQIVATGIATYMFVKK